MASPAVRYRASLLRNFVTIARRSTSIVTLSTKVSSNNEDGDGRQPDFSMAEEDNPVPGPTSNDAIESAVRLELPERSVDVGEQGRLGMRHGNRAAQFGEGNRQGPDGRDAKVAENFIAAPRDCGNGIDAAAQQQSHALGQVRNRHKRNFRSLLAKVSFRKAAGLDSDRMDALRIKAEILEIVCLHEE